MCLKNHKKMLEKKSMKDSVLDKLVQMAKDMAFLEYQLQKSRDENVSLETQVSELLMENTFLKCQINEEDKKEDSSS